MTEASRVWLEIEVDGKRGCIDAAGVERVPARHDFVRRIGDDRVFVRGAGGASVIDAKNDVVFEVDAHVVMPFREGRAGFLRSGRWGFLDEGGNVVVEPTFDAIFTGHEDGVVRVSDGRDQRLIDPDGQEVFPEAKEIRQSPRAGLVPFKGAKKKWGLYSVRERAVVLEPAFADIFGTHGEHWILKKAAKKWGAADATGQVTIEPKLPWLGPLCEGRGATRNAGGEVGFVDETGAVVVEHRFESRGSQENMSYFADGRCGIQRDGKIGFVDRAGAFVVQPRWVNGFFFGEGRGVVVDEVGWTYVDEQGEAITRSRYQRCETFAGGVGVVSTAEGKGAVRRDGAEVVPPLFRSVASNDGVLRVRDQSGRLAYYRSDGTCVWRHAEFEHDLTPALS